MSLVKMPSTRLYWSTEFNYVKVASIMTINRYKKRKKNLHCNDNLSHQKIVIIDYAKFDLLLIT